MNTNIAIIGYFRSGSTVNGGQGIKTAIVTDEIEKYLGHKNVKRIDTDNWKRHTLALVCRCVCSVLIKKNVLFLTDENGIKVFPILLSTANIMHRCKIHYYVVGGWLTKYIEKNPQAAQALKKLDAIYVEIPSMKKDLEEKGFRNIILVNKFRRITPVSTDMLIKPHQPYKLCFFARVMKEKGIEDAIKAVETANKRAGEVKYLLDIYGAVDPGYESTFAELQNGLPDYIKYKGIVDFRKSTEILKDYFAMVFPTFYKSEGYPNTVVDSYAAGLPIIATKWNYNEEIIKDYNDGILFDVGNIDQLVNAIEYLANNDKKYLEMRKACIRRCDEYNPSNALRQVISNLKE